MSGKKIILVRRTTHATKGAFFSFSLSFALSLWRARMGQRQTPDRSAAPAPLLHLATSPGVLPLPSCSSFLHTTNAPTAASFPNGPPCHPFVGFAARLVLFLMHPILPHPVSLCISLFVLKGSIPCKHTGTCSLSHISPYPLSLLLFVSITIVHPLFLLAAFYFQCKSKRSTEPQRNWDPVRPHQHYLALGGIMFDSNWHVSPRVVYPFFFYFFFLSSLRFWPRLSPLTK